VIRIIGFLVVALLTPCCSWAATTSNLGFAAGGSSFVQDGQWKGMLFTTDSSAYQLDSVTILMEDAADTSGNFFVAIFDDSAGPNTQVLNGLLSGSANPSTAGLYTYNPAGTVELAANTSYWVTLGVSVGDGDYRWETIDDTSEVGPWTLGDNQFLSFNQGGSWSSSVLVPGGLSISATVVPEPTSIVMVGSVCVVLLLRRRRDA